jgi:hypothetical protein
MNLLHHNHQHEHQDHHPFDPYAETIPGHDISAPPTPKAVEIWAEHPIPVQQRPTREWTAGQVVLNAGDQPVRVLGYNPQRVRLELRTNGGPGSVYINSQQHTATATAGLQIINAGGERVELHSCREVWASTTTQGATLYWLAEHLDG